MSLGVVCTGLGVSQPVVLRGWSHVGVKQSNRTIISVLLLNKFDSGLESISFFPFPPDQFSLLLSYLSLKGILGLNLRLDLEVTRVFSLYFS